MADSPEPFTCIPMVPACSQAPGMSSPIGSLRCVDWTLCVQRFLPPGTRTNLQEQNVHTKQQRGQVLQWPEQGEPAWAWGGG